MSINGDAALAYAARGWRVVPTWASNPALMSRKLPGHYACTCRLGPDCEKPGKHPMVPGWQNVATCDPDVVSAWWSEIPDANVSIATGPETGMFVIDIDPRAGGFESVAAYVAGSQFGMPRTLMAETGGSGRHLFYKFPEGLELRNRWAVLPGVDVRGQGGQIVAPPSRHARADIVGYYTWADMWAEGPQDAPEELLRMVLGAKRVGVGDDGELELVERGELPSSDEILAGVPEGERNETLFRYACQLRRKLNDDRVSIELLVREAGRNSGLDQDEVSILLWSAFNQDHSESEPYGVSAAQEAWAREAAALSSDGVVQGLPAPSVAAGIGELVGETGTLAFPLTDDGNSLRFVHQFGSEFRYVPQSGAWLRWDGRRWADCQVLEEEQAATVVARSVWKEVALIEDSETAKVVERWAKSSQMRGAVRAQLDMAKPKLAVASSMLDADDWLLNVRNGTLDLRSGQLRTHDRADMLTQMVETAYDPAARADAWRAFCEMIMPDPSVRWFVQKAIGYSLTGVTDAKAMFILHGSGSNGKSVFLETLRELVFGGYAGVAPKTLVMMERDEHATQLAGMAGRRFVTLSEEVEERDRLRTATLKSITGGDEMAARFMRQDFFTFVPKLKLWIATNHKPGISEFGEAMRTRLRLVPFTETIPPGRRRAREDVLAEFRAEASGVLAWAIEGLAGWRSEGLEAPTAMLGAVEDWFSDEDVFGQWLEEVELVNDEGYFMRTTDLHSVYTMWMLQRGEERFAMSPKSMGKRLSSAGFSSGKLRGVRGWFVRYAHMNGAASLPEAHQNGSAPG